MSRLFDTITALAIGAGYAYIADPTHGEKRRSQMRDQLRQRAGDWMSRATEPVTRDAWSDEMRWTVGTIGAALFLSGSRRSGSVLTQIAGAALIARAATNRPVMSLLSQASQSLGAADDESSDMLAPSPETVQSPQA
jgi:uncharacterized membrane protein